jgi:hypothetical protein
MLWHFMKRHQKKDNKKRQKYFPLFLEIILSDNILRVNSHMTKEITAMIIIVISSMLLNSVWYAVHFSSTFSSASFVTSSF